MPAISVVRRCRRFPGSFIVPPALEPGLEHHGRRDLVDDASARLALHAGFAERAFGGDGREPLVVDGDLEVGPRDGTQCVDFRARGLGGRALTARSDSGSPTTIVVASASRRWRRSPGGRCPGCGCAGAPNGARRPCGSDRRARARSAPSRDRRPSTRPGCAYMRLRPPALEHGNERENVPGLRSAPGCHCRHSAACSRGRRARRRYRRRWPRRPRPRPRPCRRRRRAPSPPAARSRRPTRRVRRGPC